MNPESLPTYARSMPISIGRCAGWLHPGAGSRGVLMVGPMGFEALCTRLSWQVLGDLLSARGLHVVRFEYPGDGDSLDTAPGESAVAAALEAIGAAAQWMRRELGVTSLGLVGLRLGALLALDAFEDTAEFEEMALLAPPTTGRTFIREQKMASQIIAELRPGQDAGPGEINLCGFLTAKPDVDAIMAMKVQQAPRARRLLLALEPDRAPPEVLTDGRDMALTQVTTFTGYGRLMVPPTESATPYEDFEAVAAWFTAGDADAPALIGWPEEAALQGDGFTETRFRFGRAGRLAGVLCVPYQIKSGAPCVHLLNAGANCHIGWARMSVEHARRLAGEGIVSLRYDFSGIGDSAWLLEGPRPHIYSPRHVEDSLKAITVMSERGYPTHVLAGLCAGGYVAFHAAARDDRVVASIAANAIRLVWHPHDNLDSLTNEMIQPSAIYKQKALSTTEWKRLLKGEIGLDKILRVATRLIRKVSARIGARLGYEPAISDDSRFVRSILQQVSQRGVRQVFIHAERDQSRDESERHFGTGARFAEQTPGVTLIDIAGADHELTPQAARDAFYDAIQSMTK